MPILTRLDNRLPPTWTGTNPELGDPFSDDATQLRYMQGDDDFNYVTDQRVQGDTIVRDLVLFANQKSLRDFMLLYSVTFNVQVSPVVVPPADSVLVHTFTSPAGRDLTVVSCSLTLSEMYDTVPAEDLVIEVVRIEDPEVIVFTMNSSGSVNWPVTTASLTSMSVAGNFAVIVRNNNSDHEVTVSGNLAVGLLDS